MAMSAAAQVDRLESQLGFAGRRALRRSAVCAARCQRGRRRDVGSSRAARRYRVSHWRMPSALADEIGLSSARSTTEPRATRALGNLPSYQDELWPRKRSERCRTPHRRNQARKSKTRPRRSVVARIASDPPKLPCMIHSGAAANCATVTFHSAVGVGVQPARQDGGPGARRQACQLGRAAGQTSTCRRRQRRRRECGDVRGSEKPFNASTAVTAIARVRAQRQRGRRPRKCLRGRQGLPRGDRSEPRSSIDSSPLPVPSPSPRSSDCSRGTIFGAPRRCR